MIIPDDQACGRIITLLQKEGSWGPLVQSVEANAEKEPSLDDIMRIIGSAATREAMRVTPSNQKGQRRGTNKAGQVNFVKKKRGSRVKGPAETLCPHCNGPHAWNRSECFQNKNYWKDDPLMKWCDKGCGRNRSHTTAEHNGPPLVHKPKCLKEIKRRM